MAAKGVRRLPEWHHGPVLWLSGEEVKSHQTRKVFQRPFRDHLLGCGKGVEDDRKSS